MLIKTKIQIYGCPIWVQVEDAKGLPAAHHAEYLVNEVGEAIERCFKAAYPSMAWVVPNGADAPQ